jgi:hypothetical protein
LFKYGRERRDQEAVASRRVSAAHSRLETTRTLRERHPFGLVFNKRNHIAGFARLPAQQKL